MKINSIYKKISICSAIVLSLTITGCDKFVEIPSPVDSIPADLVFTSDAKADAAVRNLYQGMISGVNTGWGGGLQAGLGVSSDELYCTVNTNQFNDLYINSVSASTTSAANYWSTLYNIIYNANQIIEHIPTSTGMTDGAKSRYMAEARFIRAAMYFYLVNIYGDLPLAISTDYAVNSSLPRSPVSDVYELMISDLKFAQATLPAPYLNPTQRFRANRYAASALLARVYLYRQDYVNAELMASDVIDGGGKATYDVETDLSKTFLIGSKEVILQLPPIATLTYTYEGFAFVSAAQPNYALTDALYTSFETGDLRKTNWVKANTVTVGGVPKLFPFPYKIKLAATTGTVKTEALMFLRISEVYLIRAEARAQQPGKLTSAIADLDVVRKRSFPAASFVATSATISQANLLTTIAHERFVELFSESGHRWFDLKRTGQADIVLKNKPNWRPEAKLFPIPKNDIDYNKSLVQNPGYN